MMPKMGQGFRFVTDIDVILTCHLMHFKEYLIGMVRDGIDFHDPVFK